MDVPSLCRPMTPDEERWAEALQVIKMCGDEADMFVAERIAALVGTGDAAGIARWQEIGRRVLDVKDAEHHRH